jgi:hypothetical protein
VPAIGIGYIAAAHIFAAAQQAIRRGGVFQDSGRANAVDRLEQMLPALATGKEACKPGVSCRKAGNFPLASASSLPPKPVHSPAA